VGAAGRRARVAGRGFRVEAVRCFVPLRGRCASRFPQNKTKRALHIVVERPRALSLCDRFAKWA